MRLQLVTLALGLFVAVLPMTAHADHFTITGANQISFDLSATPVPDSAVPQLGFTINNVSMTVNGQSETEDILFFEDGIVIGPQVSIAKVNNFEFDIIATDAIIEDYSTVPGAFLPFADPLYGGTEAHPTFDLGTFALEDSNTGNIDSTLTITADSVATTPEPSSIALLGTGLLGAAGVLRKRLA